MEKERKRDLNTKYLSIICGALFILSTGISFFFYDPYLLIWIQKKTEHPFVHDFANFLSSYGRLEWSTLFVSLCFVLLALISNKRKKYFVLAKICFLGGLLAGISVWPPKTILGRERPRGTGNDTLHFFKFSPQHDSVYYSLPSGHAASSMGSAIPVFLLSPAMGTPLIIMAILTGWSRIKLNEHWPSDVLAGWLLGLLCGYWIYKRTKKRQNYSES